MVKRILSWIVVMLLLKACVRELDMVEGFISVENGTESTVKIKFFSSSDLEPLDDVILNSNQRFSTDVEESENLELFTTPDGLASGFLRSDSLQIIFNNERINTMYLVPPPDRFSSPINRNIYRLGNYESIGNDEYLFTITQEDFDSATPCDGPCE